jgi:hypothetical protein
LKNKINFNFVLFLATKNGRTTNFFSSPLSFVAVFGSVIRDPGSGMDNNQDPGPATLRIGNSFLYCLTLCRRYKDSAHLNVLLISIEQLLGSNHLIITILKVRTRKWVVLSCDNLNHLPGNQTVLGVADPRCLSRNRIFPSRIPDPGSKRFSYPHQKFKYLFNPKIVSKLSEIWFIPDPELYFLPIPYPGVKKAGRILDLGS